MPAPSSSPPLPATALAAANGSSSTSTPDSGGPLFLPPSPPHAGDASVFGPGFGADRVGGPGPAAALAAAVGARPQEGARVVDWGCGLGGFGLAVAEAAGARVWGVEGRVALVERAVEVRVVWCGRGCRLMLAMYEWG